MRINLELRREGDNGRSTYGAIYMDGAFRCYTLEWLDLATIQLTL